MKRYRMIVLGTAIAGTPAGPAPALAQDTTVQSYRCSDGTNFIVGFFPYDKRAHLQIDGGEVTLLKRISFAGTRYAGHGVTLRIDKAGTNDGQARQEAGYGLQSRSQAAIRAETISFRPFSVHWIGRATERDVSAWWSDSSIRIPLR